MSTEILEDDATDGQELQQLERKKALEAEIFTLKKYLETLLLFAKAEWFLLTMCFISIVYSIIGKVFQLILGNSPGFWVGRYAFWLGLVVGSLYALTCLAHLLVYPPYHRLYALLTTKIDRLAAQDGYKNLTDEGKRIVGQFERHLQPRFLDGMPGLKVHIAIGFATAVIAMFFSISKS